MTTYGVSALFVAFFERADKKKGVSVAANSLTSFIKMVGDTWIEHVTPAV